MNSLGLATMLTPHADDPPALLALLDGYVENIWSSVDDS